MLIAGNGFGMIPKFSVDRGVHCSLRGKEPSSDSGHTVRECSSVTVEEPEILVAYNKPHL